MVRELKNIVESIALIDTSVDIEDVKAIAQFDMETDRKIRELREFLLKLNIGPSFPAELPTGETVTVTEPLIVAEQKKSEPETGSADVQTENVSFPELLELGLTEERIAELYKLY